MKLTCGHVSFLLQNFFLLFFFECLGTVGHCTVSYVFIELYVGSSACVFLLLSSHSHSTETFF